MVNFERLVVLGVLSVSRFVASFRDDRPAVVGVGRKRGRLSCAALPGLRLSVCAVVPLLELSSFVATDSPEDSSMSSAFEDSGTRFLLDGGGVER